MFIYILGIVTKRNKRDNDLTTFEDLGLSAPILKAIAECGYDTPTPIQAEAIPHVLMARDVVGLAQTGTGKTAGFTLPMIEILHGGRAKARMPRSLILSPTRELAAQIAENFETYGKYCNLNKALLIGGTNMADQIKILDRGADVLIATPGRLLDLFERGKILMNDIKLLVIDEADRMLDMGFIPDIEKICSLLPPMRQTLLFSATMAPEIKKLTEKFLSNPREVAVSPPASTATTVEQFQIKVDGRRKKQTILSLIAQEDIKNAFVFCNRKRDVDMLASWLKEQGFAAEAMHGDLSQASRTETLDGFKSGRVKLLICSDVAARGIDVDNVSHVFNYDVPFNPDDYVHRIGRTGRAGHDGRAWMLVTQNDDKFYDSILKRIGSEIPIGTLNGQQPAPKSEPRPKTTDRKSSRSDTESKPRRQSTPKQKPQQQSRTHSRDRDTHSDHENNVVGFGDEVPSFFRAS